jgi:hypothetical protein
MIKLAEGKYACISEKEVSSKIAKMPIPEDYLDLESKKEFFQRMLDYIRTSKNNCLGEFPRFLVFDGTKKDYGDYYTYWEYIDWSNTINIKDVLSAIGELSTFLNDKIYLLKLDFDPYDRYKNFIMFNWINEGYGDMSLEFEFFDANSWNNLWMINQP